MKKITIEEYYVRRKKLDEEQRKLDRSHMKRQFKLNERYVKLENLYEGRKP